jgi:hypothetical protein
MEAPYAFNDISITYQNKNFGLAIYPFNQNMSANFVAMENHPLGHR